MFKNLYNLISERVLIIIILFVFNILFYFDFLLINRLKIFLFILLIISCYAEIINFFEKFIKNKRYEYENIILNENLKEDEKKDLITNLNYLFWILLNIYIYKNYILYIVTWIEIKLFFFFRKINLFFINYLIIRQILYFIIIDCFFMPIKILHVVFYKVLLKFKNNSLLELFFKRLDGLIISIFFTSNIIKYFYYYFQQIIIIFNLDIRYIYIYFFILIYFILIIIIIFMRFFNKNLQLDLLFMSYNKLNSLFVHRIQISFIGICLENLLQLFIKINNKIELNNKIIFLMDFRIYKTIEIGGNEFKDICDELNYFKYKLYSHIINIVSFPEWILREIKNKPYMHFYSFYLNKNIGFNEYKNILWGLKKYENNEEIKKQLLIYFKKEEEIFKYIVFKLWDVEKYLGYEKNYISALYYNKENQQYENDYENYLNIEQDLLINLKKNKEEFIDLEKNFDLYINMISTIDNILNRKELFQFFKKNDIDFRDLFEYGKLEIINEKNKVDFLREYNNENLMPILKEMENLIKMYREEWVREWQEGRRNYIWKN